MKKINGSYTSSGGQFMKGTTATVVPVGIALPISLFVVGKISKNEKTVMNSYELSASLLANGIFSMTLKYTVNRERPFVTYPNDISKYAKAGSYSFPSAHTSMAFATATSISLLYPKWYIIAPAYLWACTVGYSRMYLGVHYPTDVLAGALLGTATSVGMHYLFKYLKLRID